MIGAAGKYAQVWNCAFQSQLMAQKFLCASQLKKMADSVSLAMGKMENLNRLFNSSQCAVIKSGFIPQTI